MQAPSLPFKIVALAPFIPDEPFKDQKPVKVDKMNLDQVIEMFEIDLDISVPRNLCPKGSLNISLKKIKDFHPDRIIENTPFMKNLIDAKKFIEEAKSSGLPIEKVNERLKEWPDLPIKIKLEQKETKRETPSTLDAIFQMVTVTDEGTLSPGETRTSISQIDSILGQLLGHVFSDDRFRTLESAWRGLRLLIQQGGVDTEITLEIFPSSFETLGETLDHLMPHLLENIPSLIILDIPFDNSPRSIDLLEKVTSFASTLLVPTICWIHPRFLHVDNWSDLEKLPFLPHYIEDAAFAKWRNIRKDPASQWLAVSCNRFLIRYPYGPDNPSMQSSFHESEYIWISPVWALGTVICQSLIKKGWPTGFTDWKTTRLENLSLRLIDGDRSISTEIGLTEDRIDQFIRSGIIPLISPYNKDITFIPVEITAGGTSLKYQLFLSRIVQLLFWCKDNFKKDLEPGEIEKLLREVFLLYWQKTGHPEPKNIDIYVNKPATDQSPVVHFMVEPTREILATGEKVEMDFHW